MTDKGLLSRSLCHIAANYTAESFRNSFRFIQDFTP